MLPNQTCVQHTAGLHAKCGELTHYCSFWVKPQISIGMGLLVLPWVLAPMASSSPSPPLMLRTLSLRQQEACVLGCPIAVSRVNAEQTQTTESQNG